VSEDAARAYVRELVERLRTVLGEELVGAYLIGSLALGGYEPGRSDVDVAVVVARPLALDEKEAVVAACRHEALPCPARKLELVVYTRERAPAFEVNLNTGEGQPLHAGFDAAAEPAFWFVLDLAIARVGAVPLVGPPASEVLPELPRQDVLAAARESLAWFLANDPATENLVLSACRTRRFLEEGVWSSKTAAGEWALERLPERAVVEAALARRHGEPGAELRRDEAAAFAQAHAFPPA
jgi:Domain of unknown function (DUF4111)/Nucleotidyltransferase domain